MAYDLEAILNFQNPFGKLSPLTEAKKEERRILEAKMFDKENFQNACSNLSKKL